MINITFPWWFWLSVLVTLISSYYWYKHDERGGKTIRHYDDFVIRAKWGNIARFDKKYKIHYIHPVFKGWCSDEVTYLKKPSRSEMRKEILKGAAIANIKLLLFGSILLVFYPFLFIVGASGMDLFEGQAESSTIKYSISSILLAFYGAYNLVLSLKEMI